MNLISEVPQHLLSKIKFAPQQCAKERQQEKPTWFKAARHSLGPKKKRLFQMKQMGQSESPREAPATWNPNTVEMDASSN